ncbi:MAG: DUF1566 domain-containing protein [Xanthobacter sp.]
MSLVSPVLLPTCRHNLSGLVRALILAGAPVLSLLCARAVLACETPAGVGFSVQGDEVTDRKTGLTWKRCALGMTWHAANKSCTGEPDMLNQQQAGEATARLGPGWRVPTGPELETLARDSCAGPKIDTTIFPAIPASDNGEGAKFWTTTAFVPGMFYYFEFLEGYADAHSAGYRLSVLPVRPPQGG